MIRPAMLAGMLAAASVFGPGLAQCRAADAAKAPLVESFLIEGRLAEGDAALAKRLQQQPRDDEARFGLGTLQFLRAVEHLAQTLYHYGLQDPAVSLPIVRMPLPQNPEPAKLSYANSREMLQAFIDDLARAEATLAGVEAAGVKLPLHFGRIRLDLNGDGSTTEDESLWRLYVRLNRWAAANGGDFRKFVVTFDKADVAWLRGYCHLLMALCEAILAHDSHELFKHTAHLFFARPDTPYAFLATDQGHGGLDSSLLADLIAMVHLVNLPVVEAKRMPAALAHLEKVVSLSRQSWQDLLAETDDDHEWIPNPKQTGVIPGVRVTGDMVGGWQSFLDEATSILQGKKLVPFWRSAEGKGVKLRRVFLEPRAFDLVLWVQGTAALPYLEAGSLSKPETWQRFNRLFQGEFIGFALWFN